MKRDWMQGLMVAVMVVTAAVDALAADDVVAPATVTITHFRDQDTTTASPTTFWRGDSLVVTGKVYATTGTNVVQGLSNVVVTVAVGNTDTAAVYTGTVANATGGLYTCTITVPTNGSVYLETTLTDSLTNVYTYGWKTLSVRSKL